LLKTELTDYPGRFSLALRMTLSCTLVMTAIMIFRIPGAALGAYFPLFMPRDSPKSTWRAVSITMIVCIAGTVELLTGAALFGGSPLTHLFWTIVNIFATFYFLSVMTVSSAAVGLGLLVLVGVSIWDIPSPASVRVSLTLYMLLSIVIGCVATVVVEYCLAKTHSSDAVLTGIRERLSLARALFETYTLGEQPEPCCGITCRSMPARGLDTLMKRWLMPHMQNQIAAD
jgi:multidrug resistance protein MdtO